MTDLFFLNITKKRVEQGNPEEWCARHFCVVFSQFWNFAHTIVIHIFSIFVGQFQKQFFIHKGSRTHYHICYSFPFCRNISHPFPCSKQQCSPDTYAIHFRAPGTYAIRFRSPDTDSIHLHPSCLLSISFSQASTQT